MTLTNQQIHTLGQIWRDISTVAPHPYSNPSWVNRSAETPILTLTEALTKLYGTGKINASLEMKISQLYNDLEVDDFDTHVRLSLEQQGAWFMGFNQTIRTFTGADIKLARESSGLLQKDIYEQLGVTKSRYSTIERQASVSKETYDRIMTIIAGMRRVEE